MESHQAPPESSSSSRLIRDDDLENDSSNSDTPDTSDDSPPLTRIQSTTSTSSLSQNEGEDWDIFPPLDKLTIFDFLDQLALPQRLENLNKKVLVQRENLKKQRDKFQRQYSEQKEKVLKTTDFDKYVRKYSKHVDQLMEKLDNDKVVPLKEKLSFIVGVSNIFITGFLIGGYPEWVHIWWSVQLLYFMPVRYYTYHQKGYHYFLADLCYFVNLLLLLSIWVFPNSRRLMISAYCLSYGNNAWAIAMWRNSMVFHSLDKVTSLFIHIMPPVVLHCLVHLIDPELRDTRFPAISRIKYVELYGLVDMIIWATVPYAIWQLIYHVFITVRRRDVIAAGRPTSFTWLKKSYAKTWLGKLVLSLPDSMQTSAFMFIQYAYAVVTMLPCSKFFYNRAYSGLFLSAVGLFSVYNGANYYIDVFGKRFQKELEQLKKDMAQWQNSPDSAHGDPSGSIRPQDGLSKSTSVDRIPKLEDPAGSTGVQIPDGAVMKSRNATTGSLPLESS